MQHPDFALGVKAARSLDRYLRERRRHPYADTLRLWLGSRARPTLDADGVKAMLKRRGADAGIADLHPHAFRQTCAHAFRAAGGNEGGPDAAGRLAQPGHARPLRQDGGC
jgi:site-specific recombinase XerD